MRRAAALLGAAAAAAAALSGCELRDVPRPSASAAQQGVARPLDVRPVPVMPLRFEGVGRAATRAEIAAWNQDVNPEGVGLPAGRGNAEAGARVYAAQCAVCHGARAEGLPPNPALVGREPADFSFSTDPRLSRTIGNYWPYATTLYDYVNRTMPFNAPGSLNADEVYSVVAWLLAENGVIARSMVLDARTLPGVRMPARDRFVRDDRGGGPVFR
jgi:S-disulfanyl-L-cysteine oxidoreductase SoxD